MSTEQLIDIPTLDPEEFNHPAWEEPIICRVEVDLQGWLKQLTGRNQWKVLSEDENETCISYLLSHTTKEAEVNLYNNGYATVEVDGESVFSGTLTTDTSKWAHLRYLDTEGEQILLN